MKKRRICSALMAVSMMLALSSCKKEDETQKVETTSVETTTAQETTSEER